MREYDPRGSLAPRDIVARAIDAEMKRTRRAMRLSRHHAQAGGIPARTFPAHLRNLPALGIDMSETADPGRAGGALPMRRRQDRCRTARRVCRGLYAIGEVACTGLHGANRLASNSLLEGWWWRIAPARR